MTEQLTPFYRWLKSVFPDAVGSEFLDEEIASGTLLRKLRHEDLTQLSFTDASLDFILSFDVFEHISNYKDAMTECMRVLAPGGKLLFSVPFAPGVQDTIIRAHIGPDGNVVHLMPPEYHGNPTRPSEGSLCFYHFGWDVLDTLRSAGASKASVCTYYSYSLGNLGDDQMLFIAER